MSMTSKSKAPTPETTTTAAEEADVAVRVTRDVWIDHGFAGVHTAYRAGQVVPAGREARELLERRPTAVARLDRPFVICSGWQCHSPIPIEHVRSTGQLMVEDAAEVMVPHGFMLGISHVDLRAGDLLELKVDLSRAREVRDRAAPSTFRPSGQSIFLVHCATCQGDVLVAIPKA